MNIGGADLLQPKLKPLNQIERLIENDAVSLFQMITAEYWRTSQMF